MGAHGGYHVRIRKSCADPKIVWTNEIRVRIRRACVRVFRVLRCPKSTPEELPAHATRIRPPKDMCAHGPPVGAETYHVRNTPLDASTHQLMPPHPGWVGCLPPHRLTPISQWVDPSERAPGTPNLVRVTQVFLPGVVSKPELGLQASFM
jgi:hypothetical protein